MVTVHYRRWCPPQSPLRIEFPPELLHDVRLEGAQPSAPSPLRWIPRFNRVVNQSSGLLFGVRHEDEVRVLTARADPTAWRRSAFLFAGRAARYFSPMTIWPISKSIREFSRWWWRAAGRASSCASRTEACRRSAVMRSFRWPTPPPGLFRGNRPPRHELPSSRPPLVAGMAGMEADCGMRGVIGGSRRRVRLLAALAAASADRSGDAGGGRPTGDRLERGRTGGGQPPGDSDGSERTILMLPANTSSATYGLQGSDVEVRLSTDTRMGGAHWEAARFVDQSSRAGRPRLPARCRIGLARLTREAQESTPFAGRRQARTRELAAKLDALSYTRTVNAFSARSTGRYSVSRSTGSRPASRIRRVSSPRRRFWLVVAPAS